MRMRRAWLALAVIAAAVAVGWILRTPTTPDGPGDAAVAPPAPPPAPKSDRTTGSATPAKPAPAAEPAPDPVDLAACDRDLDLFGEVVDEGGAPVARAKLQCVDYPWRRFAQRFSKRTDDASLGASTRSARDGTFAFRLARHATTTLRVSADGFANVELPDRRAGERVRVVLTRPVTLVIRAKDEKGAPAAGVVVYLTGKSGEVEVRGETGADATASLAGLPARCAATLSYRPAKALGIVRMDVVTPASGESAIDLLLPAGSAVTGSVVDAETGDAIAGAIVTSLISEDGAATGADGRFSVVIAREAFTGDWLQARAPGHASASGRIPDDRRVDFRLPRGATATGRAVDVAGAPVAGARVEICGQSFGGAGIVRSVGYATTADDGRFSIEGLRAELDHELLVAAEGRARALVVWNAARPDAGDVVLGAPRTIAGRVVDGAARPQAGVQVELYATRLDLGRESAQDVRTWTRTDDLGRFAFPGLCAGRHFVCAQVEGAARVREEVTVAADVDAPEVTLTLPTGRWVTVRVTDEKAAAVPRATVKATRESASGTAAVSAVTGPDGVARLLVREGVAHIEVEPPYPNDRPFVTPAPLDLAPDAKEATVVLVAGAAVTGTVIAPDGTAPPSSWIDAMRDGVRIGRAASAADGSFRVVIPVSGLVSLAYGGPCSGEYKYSRFADLDGVVDGVAPGASSVVLRLSTGVADRTLTVRVLSPDAKPVAGVQVLVSAGRATRDGYQRTGTDGTTTFRELPRNEVSVLAFTPDGTDWPSPEALRVRPNGQEVTLAFVEGTRIEGVLVVSQAPGAARFDGVLISVFAGDRAVTRMGFQLSADSKETKFHVFVPTRERGPFRLVASSPGSITKPRGTAEGVMPGAKDVRIELKPK